MVVHKTERVRLVRLLTPGTEGFGTSVPFGFGFGPPRSFVLMPGDRASIGRPPSASFQARHSSRPFIAAGLRRGDHLRVNVRVLFFASVLAGTLAVSGALAAIPRHVPLTISITGRGSNPPK